MKMSLRSAAPAVHVPGGELQALSPDELDRLFDILSPPASDELCGDYPGRVLTGAGLAAMPRLLASVVRKIASWLWRAKSFSSGCGINLWWLPLRRLRLVPYKTLLGPSALARGEVLILDYDIAGNARSARKVRGELRRLEAGRYLGRMLLRGRSGYSLVSYFELYRQAQ